METTEITQTTAKDARGRHTKVPLTLELSISDHAAIDTLRHRKMRQTGQDSAREDIVSEALKFCVKAPTFQE